MLKPVDTVCLWEPGHVGHSTMEAYQQVVKRRRQVLTSSHLKLAGRHFLVVEGQLGGTRIELSRETSFVCAKHGL